MFCLINIRLTQKHTSLKRLDRASLRFVVIYMRMVWTQTSARISRLLPATETKSDRSEFIATPVSCKHIRRTVWRAIQTHASLSSSRSHANTPFGLNATTPVSCKHIRRTVWRAIQTHASLSSSRSHANTPFGLNARLAWLTDCLAPSSFLDLVWHKWRYQ